MGWHAVQWLLSELLIGPSGGYWKGVQHTTGTCHKAVARKGLRIHTKAAAGAFVVKIWPLTLARGYGQGQGDNIQGGHATTAVARRGLWIHTKAAAGAFVVNLMWIWPLALARGYGQGQGDNIQGCLGSSKLRPTCTRGWDAYRHMQRHRLSEWHRA